MEQKSKNNSRRMQAENKNSSEVFASCSFTSLGIHSTLCDHLKERLGFEVPTQVQAQAIPVVLSGRHVLVNAATGSGKTVAYLAPIVHMLQEDDRRIQRTDGTFALVLVPTRELCMQVYEILQKLLQRFHWIVPGYIMGGENRSKEKARLRKGVSILVATPGRLLDHLKNTSSFVHTNLRWLVFDEADRILELGYGKDIEEIINCLGSKKHNSVGEGTAVPKQNLLLSATLNEKVNHLANMSLENPVMIGLDDKKMLQSGNHKHFSVGSDEFNVVEESRKLTSSIEEYNLPSQLVQRYIKVPCGSRLVVLLSILKNLFEKDASQKVVVFFSTCDAVDFHYTLLSEFQWSKSQSEAESRQIFLRCKTLRLHGSMNHEDRKNTFQMFKTEKSALLLSTDVSARGLDFPKVKCIIQYDSPGEAIEYVHRVGRTARLGEKGDSILFLQPVEIDYLKDLEKHGVSLTEYPLQKHLNSLPLYNLKQHTKKFVSIEMHPWVVALQRALESFVSATPKMKKLAMDAFSSWIRAYTAHRGELKQIFTVKKLHLGHVAKSFALKEQPSLVNKSIQKQIKKRKRDDRQKVKPNKRRVISKPK
ncbi:DEAD-box ATP-dependent RNA helicase 17 [Striga hermonthica]|uniref:ATP-dependent RNA helicase n=1 Tax=Striga hermonthica TaxID=68872 RepID=A0A9N7N519_STRHE|nr:DEAD-box ATP-dependent RNA helicase 17 [Striga hermonthica]